MWKEKSVMKKGGITSPRGIGQRVLLIYGNRESLIRHFTLFSLCTQDMKFRTRQSPAKWRRPILWPSVKTLFKIQGSLCYHLPSPGWKPESSSKVHGDWGELLNKLIDKGKRQIASDLETNPNLFLPTVSIQLSAQIGCSYLLKSQ